MNPESNLSITTDLQVVHESPEISLNKKEVACFAMASCKFTKSKNVKKNTSLAEDTDNSYKSRFQNDPRRDLVLRTKEKPIEADVPFFVTVLGAKGKLLVNVYPNRNGKREVQLFFNKGKYDDGMQIVRSCLRNMISFNFDKIVAVNVFRGFYLAVQTDHTNESTHGYSTNPKYKNNIGLLEYVDIEYLQEFADDCNATISPKLIQYCDEFRSYIQTCREMVNSCR